MNFNIGDIVKVNYVTGQPAKVEIVALHRDLVAYTVSDGKFQWVVPEIYMTRWHDDTYGTANKGELGNSKVKTKCADKEHVWADTGFAITWCKHCDLKGRFHNGTVIPDIEEEDKEFENETDAYNNYGNWMP